MFAMYSASEGCESVQGVRETAFLSFKFYMVAHFRNWPLKTTLQWRAVGRDCCTGTHEVQLAKFYSERIAPSKKKPSRVNIEFRKRYFVTKQGDDTRPP